MSRRIYLRLAVPVLIAAFALPLTALAQSQDSQSQSESVADAARRAREQKKAAAAKPSHVVTDDTLKPAAAAAPDANSPATAPGQSSDASPKPTSEDSPRPADSSNAPAPDKSTAAPAPSAATLEDTEKKKKDTEELAALKQQLTEEQKGLDLIQREFALQQDTYYSNPDHDKDTAGKTKLDDVKQQILDKQQEVESLKTKVAALLESLGNTSPAPAPSTEHNPPQS